MSGALAAWLASATGGEPAPAGTKLAWKFSAAGTYRYAVQIERATTADDGTQIERAQLDLEILIRVKKVADDGAADLQARLVRVVLERQHGDEDALRFDSAGDRSALSPLDAKAFDLLLKRPIALKLSPQANAGGQQIPDAATQRLAKASLLSVPASLAAGGFKESLLEIFVPLPPQAVGAGEAWTHARSGSWEGIGTTTIERTFSLDPSRKDDAGASVLGFVQTMSIDSDVRGSNIEVLEDHSQGSIRFDSQAGCTRECSSQTESSVRITSGGQASDFHLTGKVNVRLVPPEPSRKRLPKGGNR